MASRNRTLVFVQKRSEKQGFRTSQGIGSRNKKVFSQYACCIITIDIFLSRTIRGNYCMRHPLEKWSWRMWQVPPVHHRPLTTRYLSFLCCWFLHFFTSPPILILIQSTSFLSSILCFSTPSLNFSLPLLTYSLYVCLFRLTFSPTSLTNTSPQLRPSPHFPFSSAHSFSLPPSHMCSPLSPAGSPTSVDVYCRRCELRYLSNSNQK